MTILDDLRKLSSAEEFFDVLGVDYDPAVVHVARLHILRRMGEYLRSTELGDVSGRASEGGVQGASGQGLRRFVASSPIEQRVFKVHKDAVSRRREPEIPFVPLTVLTTTRRQQLTGGRGRAAVKILVCIKQVPDSAQIRVHPVTNTIMRQGVPTIINPYDLFSLEEALRFATSLAEK